LWKLDFKKNMKIIKRERGFTLFELLVSISIIGILVALASVSYSAAQRKARDARRIQDMKSIQNAAEQYYSINSYAYPLSYSGTWTVSGQTVLEQYPTDPKTDWTAYSATNVSTSTYCVCARMENTTGGNSSSNACAFVSGGAYYCVKNQQ